jgi:hypothetical protein
MAWTSKESQFDCWYVKEIFPFPKVPRPSQGHKNLSRVPWTGIQHPGYEADHLQHSSAKVKNEWH